MPSEANWYATYPDVRANNDVNVPNNAHCATGQPSIFCRSLVPHIRSSPTWWWFGGATVKPCDNVKPFKDMKHHQNTSHPMAISFARCRSWNRKIRNPAMVAVCCMGHEDGPQGTIFFRLWKQLVALYWEYFLLEGYFFGNIYVFRFEHLVPSFFAFLPFPLFLFLILQVLKKHHINTP